MGLKEFLSSLCVLCALGGSPLRADEFSQVSRQSVRLFSFGTLILDTRLGDIHIEGWDEPRVEIVAEKVVRAKNETKARPLYGQVRIEVHGADHEVRVNTLYPSRRPWRLLRGESKLSVNFHIKMPYDANLKLRCVDGDIAVRGVLGNQELLVNYGDVEIDVPSTYRLRSLDARAWLGYVESELHGEDGAGFGRQLSFWNPTGDQDIKVRVRLGGVYVYAAGQ